MCDLLAETGVAGQPGSYYRRQDIANWARLLGVSEHDPADEEFDRAYLGAVRQAGTGQTGVFGLRLMWETVAELSMRLSALYPGLPDDAARLESAFGRTLYLHLSRADKVAQAISLLRAEQSGLWHLAADGTERERTSSPQPAIYDPDRLSSLVKELEMDDAAWIAWFARHRIEPLWLSYETMAAAPQRTLADILSTLGQNPEIAATINTKTAKMADEISVEWTQRFRRESTLQRLSEHASRFKGASAP